MTKKFVVLFLMLLLPITIWAQNSVTFDFSESSKKDSVPAVMEKDGITLKLSAKPGKDSSPKYTELNTDVRRRSYNNINCYHNLGRNT